MGDVADKMGDTELIYLTILLLQKAYFTIALLTQRSSTINTTMSLKNYS